MKKITIAIDGFSSTGKSTIAKQLANKLQYIYVDTGAMYRAVTLFAMRKKHVSDKDIKLEKLSSDLSDIELKFQYNPDLGFAEIFLNGENIEKEIRTLKVSNCVSKIAEISEVRKMLVAQQKAMGMHKGIVMDGRDIGTVVFPDADLKFFMTSSAETRATRRFNELINLGQEVTFQEILENVQNRDYIDSNRKDSPLVKANDAIEIDNTNLTLKEQFEMIYDIVNDKLKNS